MTIDDVLSLLGRGPAAQAGLRDGFTFAALGPAGGGKSALLNAFFEREFCGAAEPVTASA